MASYLSDDEYYLEIEDIDGYDDSFVDQLAGATSHDAVSVDDPSFDTVEYFSDWDDLSDDYYDEEPTAVRKQKVSERRNSATINHARNPLAKRKQNHGTIRYPPIRTVTLGQERPSTKTDISTFQGVVWRNPKHEQNNSAQLHEPGNGEKVALLKNWREMFKTSHSSNGRLGMRKRGLDTGTTQASTHLGLTDRLSTYPKKKRVMPDETLPTPSKQDKRGFPSFTLNGHDNQSPDDQLIAHDSTYTDKDYSFGELNNPYSDASDTATPSEVRSILQTQDSSASSDINVVDSTKDSNNKPEKPSVSVVISPPSKSRKRKTTGSVNELSDAYKDEPEGNGKRKSRRIAPKANNNKQSSSDGTRRSTRLGNGSR